MTRVTLTFNLKEGHTKEDLIDTLKVLTFEEGMSHLEDVVQSIEDEDTIHENL
jgi:exonuclease VII small subunit